MSFKKALISMAAAAAMTSTAFAGTLAGSTVNTVVEADYTGDYLVFPSYYALANGNWATNIKVVNTNTTHAVVAKVVIRESQTSKENLDFPIYLTPGDVWEADIVNEGGIVKIQSTDDSMFVGGVQISAANPLNQALYDNGPSGSNVYGYVEVFGFGQKYAADIDADWLPNTPLSKTALYEDFNTELNGHTDATGWTAVDNDSIYGQEVIYATAAGAEKSMSMMATALANVTGTTANTQQVILLDTTLASATALDGAAATDIEYALLKSDIFVTYYNADAGNTVLQLTQPMKKYDPVNAPFYYVNSSLERCYYYAATARDQEEHANITTTDFSGGTQETLTNCHELSYITVTNHIGSFTKGYVDYSLRGDNADTVTAMPVIPTVLTGVKVGDNQVPVTNIIYPAWKK